MASFVVSSCAAAAFLLGLPCAAGLAQEPATCVSVALRNPPRTAIRCPGGLVFEADTAASLRIAAPAFGRAADIG